MSRLFKELSTYSLIAALVALGWVLYPVAKCAMEPHQSYEGFGTTSDDRRPAPAPRERSVDSEGRYEPEVDGPPSGLEGDGRSWGSSSVAVCFQTEGPIAQPAPLKFGLLGGFLVLWRLFGFLGRRALGQSKYRP